MGEGDDGTAVRISTLMFAPRRMQATIFFRDFHSQTYTAYTCKYIIQDDVFASAFIFDLLHVVFLMCLENFLFRGARWRGG